MTKLSPSTYAVLDAFENATDGEYVEGVWVVNERTMLAAALRVAASQLTSAKSSDKLRAIADELEGAK
jgi:hypothetical protein